MKRKSYKYALGLTSQLYFCSIPLRLDSYNNCAYSCGYCFARTRQGFGRTKTLKFANPDALDKRLEDVTRGLCNSAVVDFLRQRIPIQLGGMSDPFSEAERRHGTSLEVMRVLARHKYPYVISTKGTVLGDQDYVNVLLDSNVYVRF